MDEIYYEAIAHSSIMITALSVFAISGLGALYLLYKKRTH